MCQFKSAIILKNRVVLAPMYNDSHSALLRQLNIEDNTFNASKVFVRAELIPPKNNVMADIKKWRFNVDQDITPDWFDLDKERYETEMREAVAEFVKKNFVKIADLIWTPIKNTNGKTYYLLYGDLGSSDFGKNNNYATSKIREKLNNSELVKQLKDIYGDRLLPISLDLTSLDGLKNYGKTNGDILSIMNLDLYRECRENIPSIDKWFWLATPDSTDLGYGSNYVRCVSSNGYVNYYWCNNDRGVRPFFILKNLKSSNLEESNG